jgi:rhodanese-related sulfurtransferase
MKQAPSPFQLSTLWQILIILLASSLVAGFVNLIHPSQIPWVQDWGNYVESKAKTAQIEIIPLNVAYAIQLAGDHLFVDARASSEFTKGHIPESISLPFENMDEHFEVLEQLLETEMPLVVYCRNRECDDALLLAIELREMGKSNLYYYVDGYEMWEEFGCPTKAQ